MNTLRKVNIVFVISAYKIENRKVLVNYMQFNDHQVVVAAGPWTEIGNWDSPTACSQ